MWLIQYLFSEKVKTATILLSFAIFAIFGKRRCPRSDQRSLLFVAATQRTNAIHQSLEDYKMLWIWFHLHSYYNNPADVLVNALVVSFKVILGFISQVVVRVLFFLYTAVEMRESLLAFANSLVPVTFVGDAGCQQNIKKCSQEYICIDPLTNGFLFIWVLFRWQHRLSNMRASDFGNARTGV